MQFIQKLSKHIVLIIFSCIMFFPFFWMVTSALKTKEEIWSFPPTWLPEHPNWGNFIDAWNSAPFGQYIFNSMFTASIIVLFHLISSATLAYSLTQINFKGKNILFACIISLYMLPVAVTYVPSYVLLAKINLLDTYKGIILSNAVSIFGIFLMRQAFLSVPKEIVESARIDGANHWYILTRIIVPMTKPSFITLALLSFISNYNNYLWPSLITNSQEKLLVTSGLRKFFMEGGAYGIQWPLVMAGSFIVVLPLLLLFILLRNKISDGLSDNGLKG